MGGHPLGRQQCRPPRSEQFLSAWCRVPRNSVHGQLQTGMEPRSPKRPARVGSEDVRSAIGSRADRSPSPSGFQQLSGARGGDDVGVGDGCLSLPRGAVDAHRDPPSDVRPFVPESGLGQKVSGLGKPTRLGSPCDDTDPCSIRLTTCVVVKPLLLQWWTGLQGGGRTLVLRYCLTRASAAPRWTCSPERLNDRPLNEGHRDFGQRHRDRRAVGR